MSPKVSEGIEKTFQIVSDQAVIGETAMHFFLDKMKNWFSHDDLYFLTDI